MWQGVPHVIGDSDPKAPDSCQMLHYLNYRHRAVLYHVFDADYGVIASFIERRVDDLAN